MPFDLDVRDSKRPRQAADPLTAWPAFADAVRGRLEKGRAVYGARTFDRPLPEIADELGAELLDQAAYAFIAFVRLEALREKLVAMERGGSMERVSSPDGPEAHPTPENASMERVAPAGPSADSSMDGKSQRARGAP